jgi:hypothetical protein
MDITPYSNYFWQSEKIRLRGLRPEDTEKKCREWTDSQARSLLEYQLDLPPVSLETYRARFLEACDFKGAPDILSFAIESLDGELVGWANLFVGEARHGRFAVGMSIFQEYQNGQYHDEILFGLTEEEYRQRMSTN